MNGIETRFLEPLDVLFLRGNKLFGDPGSFGESLVPPWPSVAAGALRSRMLADAGVDLAAFASGRVAHPDLGTPEQPGTFAVTAFHLARRRADGTLEVLIQPPADVAISEDEAGAVCIRPLTPSPFPPAGEGMASSCPLPQLPILAQAERDKPAGGYWLTEAGWRAYLAGESLRPAHLVKSGALWQIDPRVGVGLDAATRRAADGRLFSVQAVAFEPGVGFLAAVSGAMPPRDGTLRLGGDGRAAAVGAVAIDWPEPDYAALASRRRCRLVLATPGLFPEGWRLPGMDGRGAFQFGGIEARVVCAAVPRFETVSGWDLARQRPKAALRAAPAGSVYWLEDLDATPAALRKLAAEGLWGETCNDPQRRAEGYNRVWLAR